MQQQDSYALGESTSNPAPQDKLTGNSSSTLSVNKFKENADTKRRDYDKNICRYIARLIVRMFCDPSFKGDVVRVGGCQQHEYKDTVKFFLDRIEEFSGHRAFAEYLTIYNDESEDLRRKKKDILKIRQVVLARKGRQVYP